MSRLRATQICPVHGKTTCCGREDFKPKPKKYETDCRGVRKLPDGRERCSPAILRQRKDTLLKRGDHCAACDQPFDDYREVELAHKVSKGLGGGRRDDSWSNLCLMHKSANREQGSLSLEDYLAKGIPICSRDIQVERK